ncbi:hypothetical protein LEMLEM_LOCUS15137, partial [Lemmus lemmus]
MLEEGGTGPACCDPAWRKPVTALTWCSLTLPCVPSSIYTE